MIILILLYHIYIYKYQKTNYIQEEKIIKKIKKIHEVSGLLYRVKYLY